MVLMLSSCGTTDSFFDGAPFSVAVLNTGKSDCIVITAGDKTMMIDTAEDDDADDILEYLASRGIKHLDYLIITHMDKDHVGGADTLINKLEISHILQPAQQEESDDYYEYVQAMNTKGITPQVLTQNSTFELGGCNFTVYAPHEENYKSDNDYSLVTLAQYGNKRFLFAGDAEQKRVSELLDENIGQCDFLKYPYHGDYNSKSKKFLKMVQPAYTVITTDDTRPTEDNTFSRLETVESEVYVTDEGTVELTCDGETITIRQNESAAGQ